MKKIIVILAFLHITLLTSAQTSLSSDVIKFSALYERIDFYGEGDSPIVSIAPRFYRLPKPNKKRIKPIKVDGQTYFIKMEKFGIQSVYSDTGEHVADMERDRATIHLLQDNIKYTLRPRVRLANFNVLECYNAEGVLVSKISHTGDKRLTYNAEEAQNPSLLLMSLCAHQYQELLLGDRGRLTGVF